MLCQKLSVLDVEVPVPTALLGAFFTRFGALLLLPEGRFSLGAMVTFLKFCKFRERARYLFVKCGGIGLCVRASLGTPWSHSKN